MSFDNNDRKSCLRQLYDWIATFEHFVHTFVSEVN